MERIPAELWLDIFERATLIPGALDTTASPSGCSPDENLASRSVSDQHKLMHSTHSRLLLTKQSLVLVCKHWSYLALRSFYQHIMIRSAEQCIQLAQRLEESKRLDGGSGYGWWISRLDISGSYSEASRRQILDSAPNLLIYVDLTRGGPKPNLFKNNPRLRAIQFAPGRSVDADKLKESLRLAHDLVSLAIDSSSCLGYNPSSPMIKFSHLTTLTIASQVLLQDVAERWCLPSLTHVALEASMADGVHEPRSFLRVHGASLVHLDLRLYQATIDIGDVLDSCPRLEELILLVKRMGIIRPCAPHRNVRCLGLHGLWQFSEVVDPNEWMRIRRDRLKAMLDALPGLQMINLANETEQDRFLGISAESWKMLIRMASERGISVLDGRGKPTV